MSAVPENPGAPGKPRAYRYARFSHSRQSEGMSLERQADVAEEWARQRGIVLDDTLAAFIDAGVSASRGKNIVKGALGRFREAVAAGDVPAGSYLLVESVSRFSRLSPLDSQPVLRELVEAGIRVVFFDPSIEVNAENQHDMAVGMIFQIMGYIAKDYTDRLGQYLTKAWAHKRDMMRTERKAATRMLPYWLTCEVTIENGRHKRGAIEPHPVYAPIVQRIFREYLAGSGKQQIAAALNAEIRFNEAGEHIGGVLPPQKVGSKEGKRAKFWRHGLIGRTLANAAVCGTFQPHREVKTRITLKSGIAGALKRRREPAGEPIPGYFPAVVSGEIFAQAATVREQNRAKAGAKINSGRNTGPKHILANLACCPVCGSAMLRTNKGHRTPPRYVCTRALSRKSGECQRVYVTIADVERAIIANAQLLARAAPGGDASINAMLAAGAAELAKVRATVAALSDKIIEIFERGETVSDAMNAAHTKLEARLHELEKTQAELETKAAAQSSNVIRQRVANLASALKAHGLGDIRDMNSALYPCFSRVVIDYRTGELIMHWRHGPPPTVIRYASR